LIGGLIPDPSRIRGGGRQDLPVTEVKLSSKNQIVVPREARDALGAVPGSCLLVVVRNGTVTLLPKPRDHAAAVRGLPKKKYPKGYLQKERGSWV
jgi:AbrB family looped-hinge helix DNA binding protein